MTFFKKLKIILCCECFTESGDWSPTTCIYTRKNENLSFISNTWENQFQRRHPNFYYFNGSLTNHLKPKVTVLKASELFSKNCKSEEIPAWLNQWTISKGWTRDSRSHLLTLGLERNISAEDTSEDFSASDSASNAYSENSDEQIYQNLNVRKFSDAQKTENKLNRYLDDYQIETVGKYLDRIEKRSGHTLNAFSNNFKNYKNTDTQRNLYENTSQFFDSHQNQTETRNQFMNVNPTKHSRQNNAGLTNATSHQYHQYLDNIQTNQTKSAVQYLNENQVENISQQLDTNDSQSYRRRTQKNLCNIENTIYECSCEEEEPSLNALTIYTNPIYTAANCPTRRHSRDINDYQKYLLRHSLNTNEFASETYKKKSKSKTRREELNRDSTVCVINHSSINRLKGISNNLNVEFTPGDKVTENRILNNCVCQQGEETLPISNFEGSDDEYEDIVETERSIEEETFGRHFCSKGDSSRQIQNIIKRKKDKQRYSEIQISPKEESNQQIRKHHQLQSDNKTICQICAEVGSAVNSPIHNRIVKHESKSFVLNTERVALSELKSRAKTEQYVIRHVRIRVMFSLRLMKRRSHKKLKKKALRTATFHT